MLDILQPLIDKFLPFAAKRMGFNKPPRLFLKNDSKNSVEPLGKTAYYDPNQKSVTLYITGRHPKDVMRSLSHELVHHTQNCKGAFDNVGEMGEGYAQNDEHLREMEREAYEIGNMCFRDWEDSLKSTTYYEHLQKGENKMSLKDWKNDEVKTLLSEAWGFKMDLSKLNEQADKNTGMSGVDGDDKDDTNMGHMKEEEEIEELAQAKQAGDRRKPHKREPVEDKDDDDESLEENAQQIFAPNHYCVHHGGVAHNGATHMGEAISHNYDESLGRVTHYTMKLQDGTILENIAAEDIQVTNASLAEDHEHTPGKRDTGASEDDESSTHKGEEDYTTKKDDDLKTSGKKRGEKKGDKAYVNENEEEEEELEEGGAAARQGNEEKDVGRNRMHADRVHEELKNSFKQLISKKLQEKQSAK